MEKNIDNPIDIIQNNEEIAPFIATRRSRTAEKREADSRSSNARPAMVFETCSQFNVPQSMIDNHSKQFGWSAYTVRNDEVRQNFEVAMNMGWEVGEASAYPQVKRIYKHDPDRNRSHNDEIIWRGGQIFMDREMEIKEAEDRHFDEQNYHDRKLTDLHMDPSSGMKVMSHSRTRGYPSR